MTSRNAFRSKGTTRLAASLALWLYGSTAGAAASEENAAPAVPDASSALATVTIRRPHPLSW